MNSQRLNDSLRRLLPHVERDRIAVTGGVAIALHSGATGDHRAPEDVDFVADDWDAVHETVATDFLVSHFHLPQPGYSKFLIQLVDPATGLRLDFFPDLLRALPRASATDVAGVTLLVLRPDDILDHKLATLARASPGNLVDAKHYADARTLGVICGRDVPPIVASHLTSTTYSPAVDETCIRCEVSRRADFPLAPKRAILDVLGYV